MRIKKLKLKNFAKFIDFECDFNGQVTRLVGVNGSGKSTVGLTAIWACLKGIAEKNSGGQLLGERFRFIGPIKQTADIELTLHDEIKDSDITIKNHISKSSNQISFEAPEGYDISRDWINNLLSAAFLSAKNFGQLSGQKQALLLGIDPSEYDQKMKGLKEEYTYLNRDLKQYPDTPEPEEVEPIDIKALLEERERIEQFNNEQHDRIISIDKEESAVLDLKDEQMGMLEQIGDIEQEIEEKKKRIDEIRKDVASINESLNNRPAFPQPESPKDLLEITEKLNQSTEINLQAEAYKTWGNTNKKIKAKTKEIQENKSKQEELARERLEYIRSQNFGFDGLNVDENGSLTLHGRPIKDPYFSKGELEIIVAKLYASINPEFKVRFIDDFELLDPDNQTKLLDSLLSDGFQVITAEINSTDKAENCIFLRECRKVESEVSNENKLI